MILQETKHDFDVAILGNGLSGSLLATILGKQGVSVVLIDGEQHPRFAVGESTIPHTSLLISLLAEKYDLPELNDLVDAKGLASRVCSTCGIKRHFGYVYHRPGQTYDPTEGLQFGTSARDENHWFRQDTDAYLHNLAIHYGAVPRQKTRVTGIEIDTSGVKLQTSAGEEIRARYVVDGTGFRSMLAERFGLRENPTRLKHHSRTLFTHMVDVPPFDDAHNPLPISYHNGTLHHCFERGWFWVIPFNNNPLSTNPIISVGLTIDPRRYPKPEMSAEQEFNEFLQRYPSVAEQFKNGKAVRPWVSTGRLQYSSKGIHEKELGKFWTPAFQASGTSIDSAQHVIDHLGKLGSTVKRVGVERAFLPSDAAELLARELPGITFVEAHMPLERLRARKTSEELEFLRIASELVVEFPCWR